MKNKTIGWISLILLITILLISGIWFINNQKNTEKDKHPSEITKPVDPIIEAIIKENSSAKADNLEIQKEQENGKYKVIDKKQSTKYHTVYYLVDLKTNEVERFSKTNITVGEEEK